MSNLRVSLYREGTVVRVGTIERNNTDGSIFRYLNEYADDSAAIPLSQSLPLSTDAYSEDQFRPYFEGLLAEGNAREALAESCTFGKQITSQSSRNAAATASATLS